MFDRTLLISGNNIPFPQGQINIIQPKVKDIANLTEKKFFQTCDFFNFSKDILNDKDKNVLSDQTNFDIIMSIMNDTSSELSLETKENCFNFLTLLFPNYTISFNEKFIVLIQKGEVPHSISNENFEEFKAILNAMFCLDKKNNDELSYNPEGKAAKRLADRFYKARQKVAAAKGEQKETTVLDRYISILSIGLNLDINTILNYTLYQLYESLDRFSLKEEYDLSMQARLAGAQSESLDKVEHWMKNIHS